MGKLLYLGIFLTSLDPKYETASDVTRRSLLYTDMVKSELKELQEGVEYEVFKYTGLTKNDAIYLAYAYPLIAGKLSTKPFKNLQYTTNKWTLRPEAEFILHSKEYSFNLYMTKEF